MPFPTPGAPTKIMRTARLSDDCVIACGVLEKGYHEVYDERKEWPMNIRNLELIDVGPDAAGCRTWRWVRLQTGQVPFERLRGW